MERLLLHHHLAHAEDGFVIIRELVEIHAAGQVVSVYGDAGGSTYKDILHLLAKKIINR